MKKLSLLILSAVFGSAITLGTAFALGWGNHSGRSLKIEHVASHMAQGALFTADEKGEIVPLDFRETAHETMKAVVHIKSTQSYEHEAPTADFDLLPDPFRDFFGDGFFGPRHFRYQDPSSRGPKLKVGTGSGVIINEDGYIVTNNHVIDMANDIEVTLHDNRTYKAKVIGTDPSTDLALLQIKEKNLPTIPLVNSDDVEVGQWVLAVGNPFNLNSTVTAGIVSAKGRSINILKDQGAIESFIQTDAAINKGNSGGALVNLQGGLVGINTAIASPTGAYTGYGFAVPSNIVNKVVEDLLRYGIVQRGYLGVMIRGVDANLAKEEGLEINTGVYVDSLLTNSAAAEAGLAVGDVITEVDGREVKVAPELQELIGRKRPGDEVTLTVNRQGKTKHLDVVLHNKEGATAVVEGNDLEVLTTLGADFEELDSRTCRQLGIDGGVRVRQLGAGKLRNHTGMKEGFIITKVDGTKISSLEQLEEVLENTKGGVMLEGIYEDYPGVYYYAFGL